MDAVVVETPLKIGNKIVEVVAIDLSDYVYLDSDTTFSSDTESRAAIVVEA